MVLQTLIDWGKIFLAFILTICNLIFFTAWKVFKYGIFSGLYFPVFGLNREIYSIYLRIQSKYRKTRTRKNSLFGYFFRSDCVSVYFKKFSRNSYKFRTIDFILDTCIFSKFTSLHQNCSQVSVLSLFTIYYWIFEYIHYLKHFYLTGFTLSHLQNWSNMKNDVLPTRGVTTLSLKLTSWSSYSSQLTDSQLLDLHTRNSLIHILEPLRHHVVFIPKFIVLMSLLWFQVLFAYLFAQIFIGGEHSSF